MCGPQERGKHLRSIGFTHGAHCTGRHIRVLVSHQPIKDLWGGLAREGTCGFKSNRPLWVIAAKRLEEVQVSPSRELVEVAGKGLPYIVVI